MATRKRFGQMVNQKSRPVIGQPKLIQSSYWLNLQHHLCFQIGSSMSITVMDLEQETPHGQLLKVCFDIFAIFVLLLQNHSYPLWVIKTKVTVLFLGQCL